MLKQLSGRVDNTPRTCFYFEGLCGHSQLFYCRRGDQGHHLFPGSRFLACQKPSWYLTVTVWMDWSLEAVTANSRRPSVSVNSVWTGDVWCQCSLMLKSPSLLWIKFGKSKQRQRTCEHVLQRNKTLFTHRFEELKQQQQASSKRSQSVCSGHSHWNMQKGTVQFLSWVS